MPWVFIGDQECDVILNGVESPRAGEIMTEVMPHLAERIRTHLNEKESGGWAKEHAVRIYGSDDVVFDDEPSYSESDAGVFVMAWVWVPNAENPDSASEES